MTEEDKARLYRELLSKMAEVEQRGHDLEKAISENDTLRRRVIVALRRLNYEATADKPV